jgi:lipopolysaccharide transport system ATP-binding protein
MSKVAIRLQNSGKLYKLYSRPGEKLMDALGINRLLFWKRDYYREFWALRGLNLEIKTGERVGIIGRNGAGKSTLLKIISENILPTEGKCEVHGKVQALLDMGTGFHPEFTGRENIRAALALQEFSPNQIEEAEEEIVDFAELGEFIDQPVKTYSTGMEARLAFTTATVINPEILIIDEILGVGDAYFFSKSIDRMSKLVDSGATILLVSHTLDQITRFCEKAIWLERGRIVKNGSSIEVIKAYDQFIRVLEDRRLKGKNYKRQSIHYRADQYDLYSDTLMLRLVLDGQPGARCDVSEVRLLKNDEVEERLLVGDAQDANASHAAFVMLGGGNWSEPRRTEHNYYRSLVFDSRHSACPAGAIAFNSYALMDDADYAIEVDYRCTSSRQLSFEVWKEGALFMQNDLPTNAPDWMTHHISVKHCKPQIPVSLTGGQQVLSAESDRRQSQSQDYTETVARRKWPGEGSLTIEEVLLLDNDGRTMTVFQVGTPMTLSLTLMAHESGKYKVIPVAVLFRIDGILVSKHIGKGVEMELSAGVRREARLNFGPLNLGNGNYLFSVGLYRKLDIHDPDNVETYDLVDRSYEFQVFGTPSLQTAVFQHTGEWSFL